MLNLDGRNGTASSRDCRVTRLLGFSTRASRKGEVKRRSESQLALGPDPASVQADDLLDDGETETGARDTARDAGFDPLETIEDSREIFPRNTDPFIAYRDDDLVAVVARGDGDCPSRRGVLHGIADEIGDGLSEPVGIAVDRA